MPSTNHYASYCTRCGESYLYVDNETTIKQQIKLIESCRYETGSSAISKLMNEKRLFMEEHENNQTNYKEFFSKVDHACYLSEDRSNPSNFRVIVIDNELQSSKNNVPQRTLILSNELGFTKHVIDCPTSHNARRKFLMTNVIIFIFYFIFLFYILYFIFFIFYFLFFIFYFYFFIFCILFFNYLFYNYLFFIYLFFN